MIEVLPIRHLIDEDAPIFGSLNINLGKLERAGLPVGNGVVVTAPQLHLKTTLEHFNLTSKEIFQQSLTLVKKEIEKTPVPEILISEIKGKRFLLDDQVFKSVKDLWLQLLFIWLEEIKGRIWKDGFYQKITEELEPQVVIFIGEVKASGLAFFDDLQDDVVVNIKQGKLEPKQLKELEEIVRSADKKLFLAHQYQWILDKELKIVKVLPHISLPVIPANAGIQLDTSRSELDPRLRGNDSRSVLKVFVDVSRGISSTSLDGGFIKGEKIDNFEDLALRLMDGARDFKDKPVFLKLADQSEGMGKVRGTLRLLHNSNLFNMQVEAIKFVRNKKGLHNIHLVIPYLRNVSELLKIKRELGSKKLLRKPSFQFWMEACVPENILNLEDYLMVGVDGIILNLDELVAHLNGFDLTHDELVYYKKEVNSLFKFLEDGLKLLHKSKIPVLAAGTLVLHTEVLEFLIEKGVYGVIIDPYEAHAIKDLLHQTERRVILRRTT